MILTSHNIPTPRGAQPIHPLPPYATWAHLCPPPCCAASYWPQTRPRSPIGRTGGGGAAAVSDTETRDGWARQAINRPAKLCGDQCTQLSCLWLFRGNYPAILDSAIKPFVSFILVSNLCLSPAEANANLQYKQTLITSVFTKIIIISMIFCFLYVRT